MSRKKKQNDEFECCEFQEAEFEPVEFDDIDNENSEVSAFETEEAGIEQENSEANVVYIQDEPLEVKAEGRKITLKKEIINRRPIPKVADLIRSNPINPKHYRIAMAAAKRYRDEGEGEI